jgi:hypothetical protein
MAMMSSAALVASYRTRPRKRGRNFAKRTPPRSERADTWRAADVEDAAPAAPAAAAAIAGAAAEAVAVATSSDNAGTSAKEATAKDADTPAPAGEPLATTQARLAGTEPRAALAAEELYAVLAVEALQASAPKTPGTDLTSAHTASEVLVPAADVQPPSGALGERIKQRAVAQPEQPTPPADLLAPVPEVPNGELDGTQGTYACELDVLVIAAILCVFFMFWFLL